jgi:hypothetical protein
MTPKKDKAGLEKKVARRKLKLSRQTLADLAVKPSRARGVAGGQSGRNCTVDTNTTIPT